MVNKMFKLNVEDLKWHLVKTKKKHSIYITQMELLQFCILVPGSQFVVQSTWKAGLVAVSTAASLCGCSIAHY